MLRVPVRDFSLGGRWLRSGVTLGRTCAGVSLLCLGLCGSVLALTRQASADALQQAHALHEQLLRQPPAQRRPSEYSAIISLLQPLWRDPKAPNADMARYEAAGVYVAWARDLHDQNAYTKAAQTFLDLLHQSPYTAYRRNAEWALAQLDIFHLHTPKAAVYWLRDFERRYPADPRVPVAHEEALGRHVPEPSYLQAPERAAALPLRPTFDPPAAPPALTSAAPSPAAADTAVPDLPAARESDLAIRAGNIEGIHVFTRAGDSSVVITLSRQASFSRASLPKQRLIYFDISNRGAAGVDASPATLRVGDGRIGVIRVAKHARYTRVVIDLGRGARADRGRFFPNPDRLIVGISGGELTHIPAGPARPAAALPDGNRSLTRALGLKIRRIVIDPGHGGYDTGTIGPGHLEEKNVVLDVALRLGKLLRERLGLQVIYTRHNDTFIPLRERTAIANRANADLFISIHANSSPDSAARGIETYYLNLTSNARALAVAARENAGGDSSIHDLRGLVQKIAQFDKVEESHELATDLQHSLSQAAGEVDRGVKSAPFIVLIGAHMPSVLAEISFLSNRVDDRRLRTAAYRQRLARALFEGILRYDHSLSGAAAGEAIAAAR